jgi:integrase
MKDWAVKQIEAAKPGISEETGEPIPKRYRISQSLYLIVLPDLQRRLAFRYIKPGTGKATETGLGKWGDITLKEAKEKRDEHRKLVRQGGDPVEAKRHKLAANATFASVAADYIAVQTRAFRNPKSAKSIQTLLLTHASALGEQPINQIGSAHIVNALRPLWLSAPDQARRTRAACLRVLRYAKAKGLAATNVAEIREDMQGATPRVNGVKKHFTALNYQHVPAFMRELRAAQKQGEAMSPALLEFILLTACRLNEACGLQWREIDWEQRLWILQAARSKTAREHRVPLCDRAIVLLTRQRWPNGYSLEPDPDSYVWPGRSGDAPVTGKSVYKYLIKSMGVEATIHGFRATFRTWAGNETNFDRVTCELALAHRAGDAVELAYNRGDALKKRRDLMNAWEAFCEGR